MLNKNTKIKIAINGFGRIGRAAFKIILEKYSGRMEVAAVNDLTDNEALAHLLKYDTVYGRFNHEIFGSENGITVDGMLFKIFEEKDPLSLPWKNLEVDVVLECTGIFTKYEDAGKHLAAGAKKVIISAPSKSKEAGIYVIGVNDKEMPNDIEIISNASCTTNCIAPVMKVLEDNFGIAKSLMTTIHSYTADQNLVDGPHSKGDLRRARAAAQNMVPTSTGAAIAAAKTIPSLEGKFDGIAVRVPTIAGSLADITALLKTNTNKSEINAVLKEAADSSEMKNILMATDEPIVSSDIIGNAHSAIVDLSLTSVIGGNLAKIIAWYDNEWGYSNRLVELVDKIMK